MSTYSVQYLRLGRDVATVKILVYLHSVVSSILIRVSSCEKSFWAYKNLSRVLGAYRKNSPRIPRVTVWQHWLCLLLPDSDPDKRSLLYAPEPMIDSFSCIIISSKCLFMCFIDSKCSTPYDIQWNWCPPYWKLTSFVTPWSRQLCNSVTWRVFYVT